MKNNGMIEIDGARLRKAIERRGMTIYQAGEALERSRNFLGNAVRENRIHKATIRLLDETFGVKLAEYELRKEEPKEEAKNDLADLKEIIAAAVLQALEEFMEKRSPEGITKIMEQWRTEK